MGMLIKTLSEPREMKQNEAKYETKKKIKVKLRDGKERTIQHMMATTFGALMAGQLHLHSLWKRFLAFC